MDFSLSGITQQFANNAVATAKAAEKVGAIITGGTSLTETKTLTESTPAKVESFFGTAHQDRLGACGACSYRQHQTGINGLSDAGPRSYDYWNYPYHIPYYSYYHTSRVQQTCPDCRSPSEFPIDINTMLILLVVIMLFMQ